MAHALAGRRSDAGDEADHRLFHVVLDPVSGIGFVGPADFTDHDDGIGLRVVIEHFHDVDVLQSVDRIAADANRGRLSQSQCGQLAYCLIGQRAGTRDHADATFLVDMTRHDTDLDFIRRNQPRAVRPEQQRLAAGFLHAVLDFEHVAHRDAFGDANHEIKIGLHRFPDCGSRACRRCVNNRDVRTGLSLRIFNAAENQNAFEILAGFLRVDAGHETVLAVRVIAAHAGVELAGLAGDALRDDFGIFIDQDRHDSSLRIFCYFPLAAATTFCAASSMVSAEMIGRPESASIFLPMSSLVPFMRTTSGTDSDTALEAVITPSAITSQRMMPPKMLTKMAFRSEFFSMILKASVTFSAVAPPPTSRKLAGSPPNSLMVSMVDIARPAPLTRQPMLPSREI